jgi:hypothetical protein
MRWSGWLAILALGVSGCAPKEDNRPKAKDHVRIEDAHWETVDGHNIHDFTLVNGNELAVTRIVVRFHYLDSVGNELGIAERTFDSILRGHDAIREGRIDAGPVFPSTSRVTYEVVKLRTTLGGSRR